MGRKAKDLTGLSFCYLEVIEQKKTIHKTARWLCKCVCGNELVIESTKLTKGKTRSCGCKRGLLKVKTMGTHGLTNTRIYTIWHSMISRCSGQGDYNKNYAGRGIEVCESWRKDFKTFYEWSMKNGYDDSLTIDRINTNGNYEPDNCRWTDLLTQNNNRRSNKFIEIDGVKKTIADWSRASGVKYETIRSRINRGVVGRELINEVKER